MHLCVLCAGMLAFLANIYFQQDTAGTGIGTGASSENPPIPGLTAATIERSMQAYVGLTQTLEADREYEIQCIQEQEQLRPPDGLDLWKSPPDGLTSSVVRCLESQLLPLIGELEEVLRVLLLGGAESALSIPQLRAYNEEILSEIRSTVLASAAAAAAGESGGNSVHPSGLEGGGDSVFAQWIQHLPSEYVPPLMHVVSRCYQYQLHCLSSGAAALPAGVEALDSHSHIHSPSPSPSSSTIPTMPPPVGMPQDVTATDTFTSTPSTSSSTACGARAQYVGILNKLLQISIKHMPFEPL